MPGMTLLTGEPDGNGHTHFSEGYAPALAKRARRASIRSASLCRFLESDELTPKARAIHEARGNQPDATITYSELVVRGSAEFIAIQRLSGLQPSSRSYSDVTVLAGHCLFSGRSLRLHTSLGTVAGTQRVGLAAAIEGSIEDIHVDRRLSLYELETCARLARVHAVISDQVGGDARLVLSQPRTQYYLSLLDLYQRGDINLALLRRWIEIVDDRCAQVAQRFLANLRAECRHEIEFSDSLGDFDPRLRDEIRAGDVSDPASVLHRLAANDPTFALLAGISQPRNWIELGYLGYTAEYLRRSVTVGTRPRRLLIAVEDPAERRIFNEAKAFAKRIRRHNPLAVSHAIALYPLERILVHDGVQRVQAHHHDPGFGVVCPSGRMVYAPELIARLHLPPWHQRQISC